MTQFTQRLGFNLTDAFTGDIEELAHFLKGVVTFLLNTKTLAQHLFFSGGELTKDCGQLLREFGIDDFLSRGYGLLVFNEIAEA